MFTFTETEKSEILERRNNASTTFMTDELKREMLEKFGNCFNSETSIGKIFELFSVDELITLYLETYELEDYEKELFCLYIANTLMVLSSEDDTLEEKYTLSRKLLSRVKEFLS